MSDNGALRYVAWMSVYVGLPPVHAYVSTSVLQLWCMHAPGCSCTHSQEAYATSRPPLLTHTYITTAQSTQPLSTSFLVSGAFHECACVNVPPLWCCPFVFSHLTRFDLNMAVHECAGCTPCCTSTTSHDVPFFPEHVTSLDVNESLH